MGMGNLAKMAQQMQADMARIDQELASLPHRRQRWRGVVKAVVTGKQEIVSLTIDPGVVDPEDVDMLQDLVVAAVGDALAHTPGNGRRQARAGDRWPGVPGTERSVGAREPRSIQPVARLIESLLATARHRPEDRAAATYHLLRRRTPRPGRSRPPSSRFATRSSSATAASTSAQARDVPSAPTRARLHPLCVVEEPLDVLALERTRAFRGRYHVLHGAISPMDGIGPDRLRIRPLLHRVVEREPDDQRYDEIVLATNPTLEGEATAMYLAERTRGPRRLVSRIARGIPVGGTWSTRMRSRSSALQGRRAMETVEP